MIPHHIGHITKSLQTSLEVFSEMGFAQVGEIVSDDALGARIAFCEMGNLLIEFVEPFLNQPVLMKTLEKRPGAYHYAFEMNLSASELQQWASMLRLLTVIEESEAVAFPRHMISFFIAKDGTIIEVLRRKSYSLSSPIGLRK